MTRISRIASLLFAIAAFGTASFAQQTAIFSDAEPLQRVEPVWPETDLSGAVVAAVNIDEGGNVVSVESVTGPGDVCSAVTRPDVFAIREAARNAAVKALFAPVIRDGSAVPVRGRVKYELPARSQSTDRASAAMGESAAENKRSGTGADESAGRVTSGRAFPNISGGVLNGKAVALPKPQYPAAARAVKAAGEVNVQVLISEDGQVFSAGAVSGHPLLRSASQLAACGAQFTPVLLSGTPVKVSGIIVYNFVP